MAKLVHINPFHHLGKNVTAAILIAMTFFYFFYFDSYQDIQWIILSVIILLWFLARGSEKLYNIILLNKKNTLHLINYSTTYFFFISLIILFYSFFPFPLPEKNVLIGLIIGFPLISILISKAIRYLLVDLNAGRKNIKYALVAGTGSLAEKVEKNLHMYRNTGIQIKGYIDCKKNSKKLVGEGKIVGDLKHMDQYLQGNHVDEIVIALPFRSTKKIRNIIAAADYHGIRVKYVPNYQKVFGKYYKTQKIGNLEAVNVRQLPLDESFPFFLKNSFDKVFSLFTLIFLSPVLLCIMLLIRLDSPGPVFYCPVRIGKGGKSFRTFKFRSMRIDISPSIGDLSTQQGDPRITKLGKIIRKYSLDELPQFVNVLLGDMSVVGPRPHRISLDQQLQKSVNKYMIRHYFKPGITGWAQVNGWRGPTETEEQKKQRTLHDLWYIKHWSLALDIKIIYMTLFSRSAHRNAY